MKTTKEREQACSRHMGERLRLFRKARKLTQVELAELVGINPNYLGRVERGESTISFINLLRLADALEASLNEIIDPCWQPSSISMESIIEHLQKKISKLEESDVLVLDRIADYLLHVRSKDI